MNRNGNGSGKLDRSTKLNILYVVIAIAAVLLLQVLFQQGGQVERIPYSEFDRLVEEGAVEDLTVGSQEIRGRFSEPRGGAERFVTRRVQEDIAARLSEKGITYDAAVESTWLTSLLGWMLPVLFFLGLWYFLFRSIAQRQGMGGMMQVGRSKAKIYVEKDTEVTFDDVAGIDEAKEELQELIEFLKDPEGHGVLGARVPKGVLLVGPPGTGKTLLARAVAGEAGVTFFSISGSEFVEMFVGVGAARVRDLFEQARNNAPAIIFVDELDALGRARGMGGQMGSHDEREQTLNQLLAELDGFDPSIGVVLLGATNRPEILDPALLRAGRFDRQVLVDRPDRKGRAQILRVHMRKVKVADEVDVDEIASLTTGFTGADLANLVNEAALLATRREGEAVTKEDFTRAIERIVAGLEKKNRLMNPREQRIIAHHEMGHALVSMALPGTDTVHKVSIIPRGVGALGYTIQRPTEDRFLMTRQELENKIAVLLAGRAAEKLIFGHLSTGASDDLAKATDIARAMVARYGMDESLGHAAYDKQGSRFLGQQEESTAFTRSFSEGTAERIDEGIARILDAAFERATRILTENRAILERCAKDLLEKETLDDADLTRLTRNLALEDAEAPPEEATQTGEAAGTGEAGRESAARPAGAQAPSPGGVGGG
jgi:cell division protease FtsH